MLTLHLKGKPEFYHLSLFCGQEIGQVQLGVSVSQNKQEKEAGDMQPANGQVYGVRDRLPTGLEHSRAAGHPSVLPSTALGPRPSDVLNGYPEL